MSKFHQIFYSRPLFYIAIVFMLGILFGKIINLPSIFFFSLVCLFGIICLISFILKKQIISYPALFLIVFFLGAFSHQNSLRLPSNHIANFVSQEKEQVLVKGLIINDPVYSKTVYGSGKITFLIEAKAIEESQFSPSGSVEKGKWHDVKGKVQVTLYNHFDRYRYGDLLELRGDIYRLKSPSSPGQFNYKRYLERKHIYALMSLKQKDSIQLVSLNNGNPIMRYTLKLKHIFKNKIYKFLPKQNASVISAMLLGDREDLSDEVIEDFKDSGTMHILAISGLHVGIIVLILLGILKLLQFPLKINYILTIVFIILYCLLTGARPSVVRATVMVCVFLFGKSIYRDPDIYNSLGLAALILLFYNPIQIYMAGFILSFTAVLSIVYLTPKIEKKFKFIYSKNLSFKFKKIMMYFIKLFSASFAVWIGLMPIIWIFFNIVSPVTILANLFIIPISFFILLFSIILLILSFLYFPLTNLMSYLLNLSLDNFLNLVNLFSDLKFGHFYLPDLNLLNFIVFYVGLGFISSNSFFRFSKRKLCIIFFILINIIIWPNIYNFYWKENNNLLEITFLNVAKKDSVFIKLPQGKNILINTGERIPYNSGEHIIGPFLWHKGIKTINHLILTSSKSNYIGGAEWLIKHFNIECIIDSGIIFNTKTYFRYIDIIKEKRLRRVEIKEKNLIKTQSGFNLRILSPALKLVHSKPKSNDSSVAILGKYKDFNIILFYDIQQKEIEDLLKEYDKNVAIDVVRIPYHHSIKKQAIFFLEKVLNAKIFIMNCFKEDFDKQRKNKVYFTNKNKVITIVTDGNNFKIRESSD